MFKRFNKLSDRQKTFLALGIFALLILVFYGNTLVNGFILDDRLLIEKNEYIHSLSYLPRIITGCTWENAAGACEGATHYYRPLYSLSFLLTYQISSAPWAFHLANIILFGGVVFLLFFLVKALTRNALLAFFTAFIFLMHPIHTEVVNWPSLIADPLHFIFILASLLFYTQWREGGRVRSVVFVYLFYFFAMLSKEPAALIVPPLILALDVLIFKIPIKKLLTFKELKYYALFTAPLAVYLIMRASVIGILGGITERGIAVEGFALIEKINIFFNLFSYSLKTILYPSATALLFHDFRIDDSLLNARFLFSFFVFIALSALLFVLVRAGKNILAFALAWSFVSFLPMLMFFYVAGHNVFAERFLFGSTIGISLIAAYFLTHLWQAKRLLSAKMIKKYSFLSLPASMIEPRYRRQFVVLLILGAFAASSWSLVFFENRIWKDTVTVLRANLERTPEASHLQEYLADELRRAGDREGAHREYEGILVRNPAYRDIDHIFNNLAEYERQQGNFDQAEAYYYQAIESSEGTNYKAYNNLGAFYIEQEDYLLAVANFCRALFVDPQAPEPQFNINRIGSLIQESDEETINTLYTDITEGDIMKKSEQEIIRYNERSCEDDNCLFLFSSRFTGNEIILPFLILASTTYDTLRIENSSFDPQTGDIVLETPKTYQYRDVSFIFPTCQGVYYEAIAR